MDARSLAAEPYGRIMQRVVGPAKFGIHQSGMGSIQLGGNGDISRRNDTLRCHTDKLKLGGCVGIVRTFIGMPLSCQSLEAGPDRGIVRCLGDAENFIVIVCDLAGSHIEEAQGLVKFEIRTKCTFFLMGGKRMMPGHESGSLQEASQWSRAIESQWELFSS